MLVSGIVYYHIMSNDEGDVIGDNYGSLLVFHRISLVDFWVKDMFGIYSV